MHDFPLSHCQPIQTCLRRGGGLWIYGVVGWARLPLLMVNFYFHFSFFSVGIKSGIGSAKPALALSYHMPSNTHTHTHTRHKLPFTQLCLVAVSFFFLDFVL